MNVPSVALARILSLRVRDRPTREELETLLPLVRSELADVEERVRETAAKITAPHWSDTRDTEMQRNDARGDLLFLSRGFGPDDGVSNPGIADRSGRPGLGQLQRMEVKLLDLLERAAASQTLTWPRSFRYTGKPGRTQINGRYPEPGDVVELTEGQATAMADRFEEIAAATVEEQAAATVAEPVTS